MTRSASVPVSTVRRTGPIAFTFAIALCLGVLASCGGGGGNDDSSTSKPREGSTLASGGGSSASPSSGGGGADGSDFSREMPAEVRIVNLYLASGQGEKVDVWAGTADLGKKLGTVDYATVSEPLTPLVSKISLPQEKVDGKDIYSYTLTFYTEGGTSEKEQVGQQNERAFPGDELTIVVGPGLANPQSFAPAAGSLQVLFTKTDHPTFDSAGLLFGDTDADTPEGKALVYANGNGVPSTEEAKPGVTFDVGQEDVCLPEVGPSAPAPGDTNFRTLVPSGLFYYVVPAGAQQRGLYGSGGCTGTPIGGPFEVEVGSGDRVACSSTDLPTTSRRWSCRSDRLARRGR